MPKNHDENRVIKLDVQIKSYFKLTSKFRLIVDETRINKPAVDCPWTSTKICLRWRP